LWFLYVQADRPPHSGGALPASAVVRSPLRAIVTDTTHVSLFFRRDFERLEYQRSVWSGPFVGLVGNTDVYVEQIVTVGPLPPSLSLFPRRDGQPALSKSPRRTTTTQKAARGNETSPRGIAVCESRYCTTANIKRCQRKQNPPRSTRAKPDPSRSARLV
jgi:hypothetical protein